MTESTITAKGQTTVPADVRALVHAKPGTRLVFPAMQPATAMVVGAQVQPAHPAAPQPLGFEPSPPVSSRSFR
jgi:bifunctional DNA-binding transcriptional regulator/antitoxin component of YhaV-PrlF toxin-antitoxin module